ncbi:MAG: VCBS repeat-containing protein [Deltaproteobacteria bacterium]|nr:VCBS repeat-containing protein [Deltaproteobacteria bacterium]
MRSFRLFVLLVGATLVASACGGCSCTPLQPTLSFADLPETVNCADTPDADAAAAGYQLVVELQLVDEGDSGFTTVEVDSAAGGSSEGAFDADGVATVMVTLATADSAAGAENPLTATAEAANGETISATGTIHAICGYTPPPAPECHFTTPQDGATLSSSPVTVGVRCSGGDPDDAAVQALLTGGTVVVTAVPDGGGSNNSVEIDLSASVGTGDLPIPNADGATIELALTDADGVLDAPLTDSIHVNIDVSGLAATSILVVAAGADDVLNIADNGGAASGDVTSDVTVTLNESSTGSFTGTTSSGTCTGTASGTSVSLANCAFPQGSSNIVVTASGLSTIGNTKTILVDTVAPSATISSPLDGATLTSADDIADPDFRAAVVVASTDNGATVTVNVDGSAAGTGTVASGTLSVTTTIGQGAHTLSIDIVDGAGNATDDADTAGVTVDSVAPVLVLVADTTVYASDDIGGDGSDGIQVDVTVTPTGLTAGRTITVSSDVQGDIGTCVSAGDGVAVACRVSYIDDGAHAVSASALDEAGNAGSSNVVNVNAATGLVFVAVDNPPVRNTMRSIGAAEDEDSGTAGAQVTVTGTTTAPVGAVVELLLDDVPAATSTVAAGGAITLGPVTFADGDSGDFEVVVTDASVVVGTSGAETFRVDLGRPTVSITVPATSSVTYAQAQDLSGNAGLQVDVTVAVTECEDGVITIRDGATVIGTNDTVSSTGTGTYVVNVTDLSEGDGETWTATCVDAEGNTPAADDTLTATVDITAPAAPTITVTVTSIRRGQLTVEFTEPGDQGTGGGDVSDLDVLASRQTITSGNFDTLAAEQLTAGASRIIESSVDGVGTDHSVDVAGLAYDNAWSFAVRAVDDVGNETLAQENLALTDFDTARSTFANTEDDTVLGLTVDDAYAGSASGVGDLNGDGFNDLVLLASNEGDACIEDLGIWYCEGAAHIVGGGGDLGAGDERTLTAPAGASNFGISAAVLNLDGDAFSDLVVTGYADNLSEMRHYVYYGISGATFVPATPDATLTTALFTGDSLYAVGDVDDDGYDDLVISGTFLTDTTAYLVRGSATRLSSGSVDTRSTATAINIGTAGGGATVFLPAVAGVGDVNGDGYNDFAIGTDAGAAANQIWTVAGRGTWPASIDLGVTANTIGAVIPCGGGGCGGSAYSAGDFNGDGDVDLLVPRVGALTLHTGNGSVLSTSATYTFSATGLTAPVYGSGGFGFVGDLNGDGRDDVAVPRDPGGQSYFSVFLGRAAGPTGQSPDIDYAITLGGADSPSVPMCGNFDDDADGFDDLCLVTRPGNGGSAYLQR